MVRGQTRLEILAGWKEIANYLHKGVRTAQRYEREFGLPIRRPAARGKGAVIATRGELDAWVAASPIRDVLPLPRPNLDGATLLQEFRQRVTEMHRLREQSAAMREEMRESLQVLQRNLHSALPEDASLKSPLLADVLSFDLKRRKI